MVEVGIDAIGFYTPGYFLDLKNLASARGIDPDKIAIGLGQSRMAVLAPDEDVVSMAANATAQLLATEDKSDIDTLLFATESATDQAKAAGMYVHRLLELPSRCRVVELKQACYAGTAALQLALTLVREQPQRKVLVIASDVARYGFNSSAESSQGAASVAMLVSANPRILAISPESGYYAEDAFDFWRPNYHDAALVDGRLSCDLYMRVLGQVWQQYQQLSGRGFYDHDYFCYHVSVPKLVEKTHKRLLKINKVDLTQPELMQKLALSMVYGREIGNCYTAALYVSVLSLMDNCLHNLTNSRIGLYSYGSGCVGEFFSGVVQPDYKKMVNGESNKAMLAERKELSFKEYEEFYSFKLPSDGSDLELPSFNSGKFRLAKVSQHKRIYLK